ncbi:acyltransferase, partial [Bacillus toyonensis]
MTFINSKNYNLQGEYFMSKRINELDSIRGLAAITVVFGHFCLMLPSLPNSIKFSPLRFLWAGGEA